MNNIDKLYAESANVSEFSSSYFSYLSSILKNIELSQLDKFIELLFIARDRNSSIFFIGNGGSAATASHFANDIAFGTREYDKPFKVMSLTDNVPVMTALGNDNGYEDIFVRQLMVYASPSDVVVGISASGNSPNIINAFNYSIQNEITTVSLTAFDGGKMKVMSDYNVHIPTECGEYGPAEDAHMILDHVIGNYLMRAIRER